MARTLGSPVRLIEILADQRVSAWCWGLVDGRSQTRYSWTSWLKRPDENDIWFHDLLHADGRAYDELAECPNTGQIFGHSRFDIRPVHREISEDAIQ